MANNYKIDAEALLAKVTIRYAGCHTYLATGFTEDSERPKDRKEFKTYFSRPNQFRFEWSSRYRKSKDRQYYAIWCNGKKAYSCYHFHDYKIEREKNLSSAMAGATGISSGVVWVAHSLLLPAAKSNAKKVFEFSQFAKIEEDFVNKEMCHLISGRDSKKLTRAIWLRKSDFAILKMSEEILISAEFSRQAEKELSETDPELYETVKRTNPVHRDRRFIQETYYSKVRFDVEVDEVVYEGKKLPHIS
jgi:hypothetical protein